MDFVSSVTTNRFPGWLNWQHSTLIRVRGGRPTPRASTLDKTPHEYPQRKQRKFGARHKTTAAVHATRDVLHIWVGPNMKRGRSKPKLAKEDWTGYPSAQRHTNNCPLPSLYA